MNILDQILDGRVALAKKSATTGKTFKGRPRQLSRVTGITLHQMGFTRGDDVDKYLPVTAHFIITPDGQIAQLHDLTESLWSSSALNRFTCAVEFAGNFQNDEGRWWKGPTGNDSLTVEQIEAGRHLLYHVAERWGIRLVYAHRQGGPPSKANCCGPEIWRAVGQYAIEALGFIDTTGEAYGKGSPIPKTWKEWEVKT